MAERPSKQQKLDAETVQANVIIQFQSPEGEATGEEGRWLVDVSSMGAAVHGV